MSGPGAWFGPGSQFAKPLRTSRESEFRVVREDIARLARLLGIETDGSQTAHAVMTRIIAAVEKSKPPGQEEKRE